LALIYKIWPSTQIMKLLFMWFSLSPAISSSLGHIPACLASTLQ
jgi:hypothetical protein